MKRNAMISAVFAAALVAGLAVEPAEAGFLGKLKEKAEEKLRKKAREVEERFERKVGDVVERAEDRVERRVEGVVAEAEAEVEGVIDGAVGDVTGAADRAVESFEDALDGAVDGAVDRVTEAPPQADLGGSGNGGAFFAPPPGVSNVSELREHLAERKGSRKTDMVSVQRRLTRDAYFAFWGVWFRKVQEFDTYLGILRKQRDDYLKWGAVREAEGAARSIADLEARRREFVEAPKWENLRHSSAGLGPLGFFGLELGSEALPAVGFAEKLGFGLKQAGLVSSRAESDRVEEEFAALVRDIVSIRNHAEAGELEAAQRIMDRRWAWVMAD